VTLPVSTKAQAYADADELFPPEDPVKHAPKWGAPFPAWATRARPELFKDEE
jgi:hypothetical protein